MARQMSKESILVADDNPNNLLLMEDMLTSFGYEVRMATNGRDALNSIEAEPPDAILLDIHMPVMDGYETCRKLKQNEATKNIPVIFVSAMNEEFNKVMGFDLGAVDYVSKPISMQELKARVNVHIHLARQHQRLQTQAAELKAFNDTMLDREMRVIELKEEVNALSKELGRSEPYIIPR